MRNSHNITAVCEDAVDITEAQAIAARRTVASYATDAQDASELLKMLGIHFEQESDTATTATLPQINPRSNA